MKQDGRAQGSILLLWSAVAALLAGSAMAGRWLLADVDAAAISVIEAFSAGAILASLSTKVFPKAGRPDPHAAGVAIAVGLVVALALGQLG